MTIIPRGPKFGVSIKDPTHPKGQRWVGTFATEAIALQEESAAKREVRKALEVKENGTQPGRAMTVERYVDRFLDVYCDKLETGTHRNYRLALVKLVAAFPDRELHSISRVEAVDWSRSVALGVFEKVRFMFRHALNDDVITVNVFDGVIHGGRAGKGRGGDRLVVLTDGQLIALTDAARRYHGGDFGERFAVLVTVAAYTAMRPGELVALRWEDVDFKNRRINVCRSRRFDGKEKLPKNGKTRKIVLPLPAATALAELPRTGPLVFTTKTGRQFSPSTFATAWQPVRAASGAPIEDLYELRHYCATKLMEAGLQDWQVARQMGHTDNGLLVRQTYFHPKEEDILDAIDGAWGEAA